MVDVAHARWATSTCITSLDLCAAAFGRVFCGRRTRPELALGAFDPASKSKGAPSLRAKLPPAALAWTKAVFSDPQYAEIKLARNSLTHGRLLRHFGLSSRIHLEVGARKIEVSEVIEASRDLSARHISSLFSILPAL